MWSYEWAFKALSGGVACCRGVPHRWQNKKCRSFDEKQREHSVWITGFQIVHCWEASWGKSISVSEYQCYDLFPIRKIHRFHGNGNLRGWWNPCCLEGQMRISWVPCSASKNCPFAHRQRTGHQWGLGKMSGTGRVAFALHDNRCWSAGPMRYIGGNRWPFSSRPGARQSLGCVRRNLHRRI